MLREYQTERIIEVGPTDTLTNMLTRTRDLKYRQHDAAHSVQRRFLSSKRARCNIYHDADESQKVSKSLSTAHSREARSQNVTNPPASNGPDLGSTKIVPVGQIPAAAMAATAEPTTIASLIHAAINPTTHMAKKIPYVPVSATEIIRAVVACALKKDPKGFSFSSTVKSLAGGRPSNAHMSKRIFADEHSRQVDDSEREYWGPRRRIWLASGKFGRCTS